MSRFQGAMTMALVLSGMIVAGSVLAGPAEEIRTLLPKDGIPSIDNPKFATVAEADKFMEPDEMVIGVDINGHRRAYSVPLLSSHEIVNDVIGGRKIAVTW